ncbi:oxysterol-binding protein-related protein 9/10/11 [Schistosoma bovis]|uniref:Oxysterol-binding protein n=2 Tax=Schistosoma bovis TaxID=6184 RepID=A0A430QGB5_SCHBO|nr:oxysterol-binding protein-related protein 9/10/11 [Schistosoma bovis]
MDNSFTMEGPLSKWTNLVNGWQYRWFVLDISLGVLSYYTVSFLILRFHKSKEKMMRGDRRGCVKLKNAQVGIDDEDDSTFTITVDHKTFHFQARNSDERQKWLDALQEARDLHTQNYALLNQVSDYIKRIIAFILFDFSNWSVIFHRPMNVGRRLWVLSLFGCNFFHHSFASDKRLIELVKKTIVCLQFARGSVNSSYRIPITMNDNIVSDAVDIPQTLQFDTSISSSAFSTLKVKDYDLKVHEINHTFMNLQSGEGDGENPFTSCQESLSNASPIITQKPSRKHCTRNSRRLEKSKLQKRPSSTTESSIESHSIRSHPEQLATISSSLPNDTVIVKRCFDALDSPSSNYPPLSIPRMPVRSYSSSDDDQAQLDQEEEDEEFFDTQEDISVNCAITNSPQPVKDNTILSMHSNPTVPITKSGRYRSSQSSSNNQTNSSLDDTFDELYDDEKEEECSVQSHGSVITHLLSQLRIGMDLTRITLPTFILERRSTLEMYADFLAHADLWAVIPNASTPRDRMVACLRWYLSAFHAGRRSSVAKKPYNPTLGEIFRCYWPLSTESGDDSINASEKPQEKLYNSGPVPWAPHNSVVFLAEQVSHHPPISAFYAEHVNNQIAVDGHLWTKSKFLGLSIAVEMVGSAVISLLSRDEEYVVTFPCGYGRNILTVPWIELGGKTSITCLKTGYIANIEFRTKPFYGGKRDTLRAEVFGPNDKKAFLIVEGEWNDKMLAKWPHGYLEASEQKTTKSLSQSNACVIHQAQNYCNLTQINVNLQKNEIFIDTRNLPTVRKHVLPRSRQEENESRRLWEEVTYNLKVGNIDAASDAKHRLEQRQRDLARQRRDSKHTWTPKYFREEGENWIYRHPLIQRLHQSLNQNSSPTEPRAISKNTNLACSPDIVVNPVSCNNSITDSPQIVHATTTNSSIPVIEYFPSP